jgi:hypothetical protein
MHGIMALPRRHPRRDSLDFPSRLARLNTYHQALNSTLIRHQMLPPPRAVAASA